jgi:hypothetical protein
VLISLALSSVISAPAKLEVRRVHCLTAPPPGWYLFLLVIYWLDVDELLDLGVVVDVTQMTGTTWSPLLLVATQITSWLGTGTLAAFLKRSNSLSRFLIAFSVAPAVAACD